MNYSYKCEICKKEVKKTSEDYSEKKWWEIWKWELHGQNFLYEISVSLEMMEKLGLPKLINKYPTEYQKVKTILSKVRKVEQELVKPIIEKQEEVLWKFFYKKGKMMPQFMRYGGSSSSTWDICESCNSELETLINPYKVDQIESQRIINKLEEAGSEELFKGEWQEKFKLLDEEKEENKKEYEKLIEDLIKNKEKELNNKILTERERERANRTLLNQNQLIEFLGL